MDIKNLNDEDLVSQLITYARYAGVEVPSDPYWYDPRPSDWGLVLEDIRRELLSRLEKTKGMVEVRPGLWMAKESSSVFRNNR